MSDLLPLLGRMNLAVSAAIVVVLLVRLPLRRLCGPEAAYGLWSLVPLSAAAMLLPARVQTVHAPRALVAPALDLAFAPPPPAVEAAPATGPSAATLLFALWLAGAAASLAWLAVRQAQFARAVRQGRAGPAVVGVLRPRIVAPADFATRYSPREQALVLAHERTHLARHDSRINALAALGRSLAWFNPLAHLFVHLLRVDQELACDARVVAAHPQARRAYAEAMLKAQLAARPLPLGCYWPASAAHPLAQRVALLALRSPSRLRRRLGAAAVAGLGVALAASAWAARPVRVVTVATPLAAPAMATASPAPAAASASAPRRAIAADPIDVAAVEPAAAAPVDPPVEAAIPQAAAAPVDPAPRLEPAIDPDARYRPRVAGAARRSSVEPGSAVRVTASLADPSGARLLTDLTSFGSQSLYRSGVISRPREARYSLFTSVVQQGDRYLVTASLGSRFAPPATGTVRLAAGESGRIYLPNGVPVEVSVTVRPETPEEVENGRLAVEREASRRPRYREIAWEPFQCGRRGAVC